MPPIGREVSPGHRVVSASMVPNALVCPHCGSKDFSTVGWFKRYFEQPYVDGKATKEGLVLGQQPVQTIEAMVCKGCSIHTIIEDDNTFEREMVIFDLQTENKILKGSVITTLSKELIH